jgi:uncharacterized protein (DUF433 family)
MDWTELKIVEIIPGKVSGAPLLVGTRIPVSALIENYEAFLEQGMTPEEAIAETLDCYPAAGEKRLRDVLAFHEAHQHQLQP